MEHPIQPSIDLIRKCTTQFMAREYDPIFTEEQQILLSVKGIVDIAFQAGADQELEACDAYVSEHTDWPTGYLTSARRPKPPNLKKQAMEHLQRIEANIPQNIKSFEASCDTIRQALEQLSQ